MNVYIAVVEVNNLPVGYEVGSRVARIAKQIKQLSESIGTPLAGEAGEALVAGEELLHGGLLEVALLGDELGQRAQQRVDIPQRLRDGALFGKGWHWSENLPQVGLTDVCPNSPLASSNDL